MGFVPTNKNTFRDAFDDFMEDTDRMVFAIKKMQEINEELRKELEDLQAEVDKQYEQAKADILGNMADGGVSCHWCIAEHEKIAVRKFAERLKMRVKEAAYEQLDGGHVCESEIVGVINELAAEMEKQ